MSRETLPALFVSHGPPSLLLMDDPTTDFLQGLAADLPARPRAVLVVSAHWETRGLAVTSRDRQEAMYDFHGFPDALYAMTYDPPGDAELTRTVIEMLGEKGYPVSEDPRRTLDHGAWMPLKLIYPDADIPVVQLSLPQGARPDEVVEIGRSLAPLRAEGVLILASGNLTHNLYEAVHRFRYGNSGAPDWVSGFQEVIEAAVASGDGDGIIAALNSPQGRQNHPTAEHFLPFFLALGAGGGANGFHGRKLHADICYDVLAMDAYAFDEAR